MKSRQSRSQRVTVKQGMNLQRAVAAGCALALVIGVGVFGYLNLGNSQDSLAANAQFYAVRAGDWSDTEIWEGQVSPPTQEIKHNVEIFKKVMRRGHLRFAKGSKRTLTVNDTLVVLGNLSLGNKSGLIVNQGGVLVIAADFRVDKKSEITNYGTIAVGGDWSVRSFDKITYLGDTNRLYCLGSVRADGQLATFGQNSRALQAEQASLYRLVKHRRDALKPVVFTAHLRQGRVMTQWVAEGETATYNFAIERSTNGMLFDQLMTTEGETASLTPTHRTFVDTAPASGASYYRLRRTAPNGNVVYSKLVMVVNGATSLSMNRSE